MPLVMMVVVIVLISGHRTLHQGQSTADGGVAGPSGHRVQQRVTHAGT